MQEIQSQDQGRAGSKDSAGVIYFASQVVSLLAERNWRTFSELREPVVSGLITAALSGKKDRPKTAKAPECLAPKSTPSHRAARALRACTAQADGLGLSDSGSSTGFHVSGP